MRAVLLLALRSWGFVGPQKHVRRVVRSKKPDYGEAFERGLEYGRELSKRFTSPKIDDQGLVIADALISGVVAPGLEAIVCTVAGLPPPSWLGAFGRGRLVAPVLVRGVNLASCWIAGALAACCYEREVYDFPPPDGQESRYATTFSRVLQAGSFATALLLFSTQLQVTVHYGFGVQFGDSPETDATLFRIADDVLRDVGTEALVLLSWRLARTNLSRLDL